MISSVIIANGIELRINEAGRVVAVFDGVEHLRTDLVGEGKRQSSAVELVGFVAALRGFGSHPLVMAFLAGRPI